MADKTPTSPEPAHPANKFPIDEVIAEVRAAVEKVRFGSVQLIIQDGRIVQIDTIEKKRLS
jgi:hypothetical protein